MPGMSAAAWAVPIADRLAPAQLGDARVGVTEVVALGGGRACAQRSNASSRTPLTIRNAAAELGEANSCAADARAAGRGPRPGSCRPRAASPAGRRCRRGSRGRAASGRARGGSASSRSQKKKNRTIAVARWVATRKVRKNLSFWWMSQPRSRGRITPWPRLEIGNGSAMPWSRAENGPWKGRSGRAPWKVLELSAEHRSLRPVP